MTIELSIWLLALVALLAFGSGWTACAVFGAVSGHTCRRGHVDLGALQARGELLHLDWGDPRFGGGKATVTLETPTVPVFAPSMPFTLSMPKCDPVAGTHFHGEGDVCQCGQQANVVAGHRTTLHAVDDPRGLRSP